MAHQHHTPRFARTEDRSSLCSLIDDAYPHLNPRARCYESIKRLSDSEVIALALFGQLRGVQSERSFLRDAERFFAHLFPGFVGLCTPSSLHRRVRRLRRFWSLAPGQASGVGRRSGDLDRRLDAAFGDSDPGKSGTPAVSRSFLGEVEHLLYGAKLVLSARPTACPSPTSSPPPTPRTCYWCTSCSARAGLEEDAIARRLFADLAYRSARLKEELAEAGVVLQTERAERRPAIRQQAGGRALKRVFGIGETLATTLVGLARRVAEKVSAYTYGLYIDRLLGRPQGLIKALCVRSSQHSSRVRREHVRQLEAHLLRWWG